VQLESEPEPHCARYAPALPIAQASTTGAVAAGFGSNGGAFAANGVTFKSILTSQSGSGVLACERAAQVSGLPALRPSSPQFCVWTLPRSGASRPPEREALLLIGNAPAE
jgi:hypothetical protein